MAFFCAIFFTFPTLLYGNTGSFRNDSIGLDIIVVSLPMLLYSLITEILLNGQTLGKKLMNIRVVSLDGIGVYVNNLLEEIQNSIYIKAKNFQQENIREVNSWEEFKQVLDDKAGFISAHWDGTAETEEKIKQETKATIRCIPLDNFQEEGVCVFSGKPSKERVIFARAY